MPEKDENLQPHIFLFHGEDSFSSNEKLNFWKAEFIKKHGDNDLEMLDGEKINPSEFTTNITAAPFLSEKRMIIVKNIFTDGKNETQKQIAEYLEDVPQCNIIIFFENSPADKRTVLYKKLNEIGKVEYFPSLNPNEAFAWLNKKTTDEKAKISPPVLKQFIAHCGTDLWHLSKEFEKLKLYADGSEITPEMIESVTIPSLSASIFSLTDSIGNLDHKKSLKILKLLADSGEEVPYIFHMIVRQFRLIIQIKDLLNKKEPPFSIAKKLKQNPYVVKVVAAQCRNFTFEQLKKLYSNLLRIDLAFKTGGIKMTQGDTRAFELALEKFIINP